ncbi:hypothetical protein ACFO5R_21730 [Halosolutus amylolyticus]|uniref:NADH dehydrogenase subunit 6 n=1 Tax=Halosolutus amylolyticus TaxID=2932267 RepID=A0ABD5PVF4_9EURY|nr:hypothetical protein [Halosolutus amylolyticus]
MEAKNDTWVVFLILGMTLLVFGILFLEGTAWYVTYPVFAAALLLSGLALVQATSSSPSG